MKKIKLFINKILAHQLTRSSAIVFVGSMVANVSAYLYHLAVGRILGPEAYGELTAILSLFFILNVPSQVLQTVMVKFFSIIYARDERGQATTLFWKTTKSVAIWGSGLGIIYLFFVPFLMNYLHINSFWNFIWLYIIFIFFILSIINACVLQGFQKFAQATSYAALSVILRLIVGVPAALFGVGWTLMANAFSNLLSYLAYFLPIGFILKTVPQPLTSIRKSSAGYALSTLVATLGFTGLYTLDILYVRHFFSAVDAGLYSSATVLGKIIFFATSAVGYVLFPVIAARGERKERVSHLILFSLLIVGGLSFGLVVPFYMFPDFILNLLFGSRFQGATAYLGNYGLFIALIAIDNLLVSSLLALGRTRIWLITITVFLLQGGLIYLWHESIMQVMQVNILVASVMFVASVAYLVYSLIWSPAKSQS